MQSKPNRVDLDGRTTDGLLSRKELLALPGLRVHSIQGNLGDPLIRRHEVHEDRHVLSIGIAGTVLYVDSASQITQVLPSESSIYLHGELKARLYYARGRHHRVEFEWHTSDLRTLNQWVNRTTAGAGRGPVFSANLRAIDETYTSRLEALREHLIEPTPETEPLLMAAVHEFVGAAVLSPASSALVSVPDDSPAPLRTLMLEVKANPTLGWSLKEAAGFAGYSPFHLSRTFRTAFDYGFPEFVDRCRTELAITKLLATDMPIEDISTASGFGSTQALRESFKEYLGLLPSELRTLTHNEAEA